MADTFIPVQLLNGYNEDKGTLAISETDKAIAFGEVIEVFTIEVINDSVNNDIELNIDATDRPAITIKAGEARSINFPAKKLFLTNTAASTTDFRVLITGKAA